MLSFPRFRILNRLLHFYFQAGPVVESILRSFPDYIKVKDLPHEDTTYKVNNLHLFSLRFSLITYLNELVFRLTLVLHSTR